MSEQTLFHWKHGMHNINLIVKEANDFNSDQHNFNLYKTSEKLALILLWATPVMHGAFVKDKGIPLLILCSMHFF